MEDLGQKRLEVTQCHVLEAGLDSVMPPVDFWPKTIGASCSRCLAISINIFVISALFPSSWRKISGKGCATFEFLKRSAMLTMT